MTEYYSKVFENDTFECLIYLHTQFMSTDPVFGVTMNDGNFFDDNKVYLSLSQKIRKEELLELTQLLSTAILFSSRKHYDSFAHKYKVGQFISDKLIIDVAYYREKINIRFNSNNYALNTEFSINIENYEANELCIAIEKTIYEMESIENKKGVV